MIDEIREKATIHKNIVFPAAAGVLLVGSLGFLVTHTDDQDAQGRAEGAVSQLQQEKSSVQAKLDAKHQKLREDLTTVDAKRVDEDVATGRSVLLSLTDSSASTRDVAGQQHYLDARFEALDDHSQTLRGFLPEWMTATGSTRGAGTVYTLDDLDIDVASVRGLNYSYVGVAHMTPVEGHGEDEYVLLNYSTDDTGEVTSIDAYLASDHTRDALSAAGSDASDSEASDGGSDGGR